MAPFSYHRMVAFRLVLVYDEDIRLVVYYLMKQDLWVIKYWRKFTGVSQGWSYVTLFDETGPR